MREHAFLTSRQSFLVAALVFMLIAATRLLALQYFGSEIPYWDQWDSEGWILLRPFQKGDWDWRVLFSLHNEHRILLTRLTTLTLFIANNRQWDNLVSVFFNALFYAAAFALILRRLTLELSWRSYMPLFVLALVIACLPFCPENLLTGFQSQFYYMIVLAAVGIWVAAAKRPTYGRIAGLVIITLACVFSMASGALSIPTLLAAAVLRWWRDRKERGRLILLGAILIPLFFAAMASVPKIPGHEPLRAQNLIEFLYASILHLSWPFPANVGWAIFLWAPCVWASVQVLRGRLTDSLGIAALCLGAWVVLQALAMSYVRGHYASEVASRYTDIVVLGTLVNAYFAIRYCQQVIEKPRLAIFAASCLLALQVGAMAVRSKQGLEEMAAHAALSRIQVENVRHFLKTGDVAELRKQPLFHIPYPDPDRLAMMLNDPIMRDILPFNVRTAMRLQGNTAFVANGYYPAMPIDSDKAVFGSYTPVTGDLNIGELKEPLKTRFPYLSFDVAGYPNQSGMKLSLASTTSQREQTLLTSDPHESWIQVIVPVPTENFTLEAIDRNQDKWVAFSEPVEIGRLSLWVTGLLSHVLSVAIALVFLTVLLIAYIWLDFWHGERTSVACAHEADKGQPQSSASAIDKPSVLRRKNPVTDST